MNMNGERMAKRSSGVRRRLSDVTNSQSQLKLVGFQEKQPQISVSSEDFINRLLKEKETLVKLIEERNKIIELSGNELRNLRMSYQKLQRQNLSLAQSNSQILAELNIGREKLKALQHELVCKDALLKAKVLPQEEVEKVAEGCLQKDDNDSKSSNRSRRRAARSQSMGPSTTHRRVVEKEKAETKRRCMRRQSARFKFQEREPAENLFEIEDAKFPVTRALKNQEQEDPRDESPATHRSSLRRPLRKAAEKVQSYKEGPLNVKMRRQ